MKKKKRQKYWGTTSKISDLQCNETDEKEFRHKGTLIQCTDIIEDDGYPSAKGN